MIARSIAQAEGHSGRLLDFAKVTSPLLGLQQAFSQATLGSAAVERGIATALHTTYAGILIAIAAFFTLRFLLDPALERLEAELWDAEGQLSEYARLREQQIARIEQRPGHVSCCPSADHRPSWQPLAIGDEEPLDGQ
jgi:hypothetical protein